MTINRVQALVVAVFAAYWVTVVVILIAARDLFDQGLKQLGPNLLEMTSGNVRLAEFVAVTALTVLLAILSAGVVRGWRWTFWLIVIAFLVNGLRVPLAALQLLGVASSQGLLAFAVLQVVVGLTQFVIGVGLLVGYRKAGVWGGF